MRVNKHPKEQKTILLADDHKVVREGLKYLLNTDEKYSFIFHEAVNGKDAVLKSQSADYDLILMDITMPEMDGINATELICRKKRNAKIIALSMHDEEQLIIQMLKAGASAYILKNSDSEEIFNAIHSVLSGKKYLSNLANEKMINFISKDTDEQNKKNARIAPGHKITHRELEILRLIVQENTAEEIAQKLNLSRRTIDGHRQKLLHKTGARNTAGLIRYAYENLLI
jgi:DNA-binding NarL/FixJ family response regulator